MSTSDEQRAQAWSRLRGPWDLIVIGGGITGAGILREASRAGLRALLVEQRDFAWGTSSRSSKLVHGGLRYLATGQLRLTWESVRERQQLLAEGPGLVEPMSFLLATYGGDRPGRWSYAAGLAIYDVLAGSWRHEYFNRDSFRALAPHLETEGLEGGFRYHDATTDDARLVLRVLEEATGDGGTAMNYAEVVGLVREQGSVVGVTVKDAAGALADVECRAAAVISATGAWADRLRVHVDAPPRMRPLRGSHLVLPHARLPLTEAIALQHPTDHRAMFVYPWEGASLVGTTDLDYDGPLDDASITPAEVAYLLTALDVRFPKLGLGLDDVVSTYSGVRPVVNTGAADPSKETREHVVWDESGLVTVTGGKLTTFRLIAHDALRAIRDRVPKLRALDEGHPLLDPIGDGQVARVAFLPGPEQRRLFGRHGNHTPALVHAAEPGELDAIDGSSSSWAELRWASRREWVVHLEDLLLRRVRVGLVCEGGGAPLLPRVRVVCQRELGWSDARWHEEEEAYLALWNKVHGLPDRAKVHAFRPAR